VDQQSLTADFYATDAFTKKAVEFIAQGDASKPFFLYLAYNAPHAPLQAPEDEIAKHRGKYDSGSDKEKLDQYLTSVRELETGIARDLQWADVPPVKTSAKAPAPTADKSKEEWMPAIYKLIALAFEADLTRVVALAGDGPGGSYDFIPGVVEDWHPISHHNRNPEKLDQMAKINEWSMTQLGGFLDTLAASKDPEGRSLLDSSLILTGDSMTDGQHWGGNYPLLLSGHGGGLKQGQHLKFCENPRYDQDKWPLASVATAELHLAMLKAAGAPVETFAGYKNTLKGLA